MPRCTGAVLKDFYDIKERKNVIGHSHKRTGNHSHWHSGIPRAVDRGFRKCKGNTVFQAECGQTSQTDTNAIGCPGAWCGGLRRQPIRQEASAMRVDKKDIQWDGCWV